MATKADGCSHCERRSTCAAASAAVQHTICPSIHDQNGRPSSCQTKKLDLNLAEAKVTAQSRAMSTMNILGSIGIYIYHKR